VSSSFLDVYKVFTVGALQGPFGFMFSPWLIFSKTILFKHKDKILNRKPIWTSDTQIPFMCDNSTNIINNLAKYHTFPKDFFDALLGNNIPKNLYIRRQGFQTFRYKFLKREPVIAIGSMLKSLRKKIFKYSSPCAPVITINSNVNSTDIKTILEKNLLSVFHEIILKNESVSFLRVRSIMARQRLVVLINIRPGSLWILLNKNYYFEYNLEQIESLSEIMDNILDNMKVINES